MNRIKRLLAICLPCVVLHLTMMDVLSAQFNAASYEDRIDITTFTTQLTRSDFKQDDVWDETTPPLCSPQTIRSAAEKTLSEVAPQHKTFLLDSVRLVRFYDTNYWYYVVEYVEGGGAGTNSIRIVVRLNGTALKPILTPTKNS